MPVAMKNTPVSARSGEREVLASAIQEYDAAIARRDRVRRAKEEATEVSYRTATALKKAETALEAARQGEASRLASIAIGELTDVVSVADAELAVTQAANDRTVARNTLAALEARETAEQHAVETALRARDEAVRAVVQADAATQRLAADYRTTQKAYLDLCKLMSTLRDVGCCPVGGTVGEGYSPQFNAASQGTAPAAPAWLAAISALATDADAELPQA